MRKNDRQLGLPAVAYKNTRANIEGLPSEEGMVAYATDIGMYAVYDGAKWKFLDEPVNENLFINGYFQIWQIGSSFTNPTSGYYLADMMKHYYGCGGTRTISQEEFAFGEPGTPPNNPEFYLKFDQTVAGDGASSNHIDFYMEDLKQFAGKTISISFYGKSSSTTSISSISAYRDYGSGGSDPQGGAVASSVYVGSYWEKFSYTYTFPALDDKTFGAGNLARIIFYLSSDTVFDFCIANLKVEFGSVATEGPIPDYQDTLDKCQYYYEENVAAAYPYFATGVARTVDALDCPLMYKRKRTDPTITCEGNFEAIGSGTVSITSITGSLQTRDRCRIQAVNAGGFVAGSAYVLRGNGDFTAKIKINSRL